MTRTQIEALRTLLPDGTPFDRSGPYHGTLQELRHAGLCDWALVLPDRSAERRTDLHAVGSSLRHWTAKREMFFARHWRLTEAGRVVLQQEGSDAA